MDHKFTEQVGQWLNTPEAERDYSVGALFLLKLSGNRIMYQNIIGQLDRRHDFIDYQLQKYYNFRVQQLTHAQVEEMAAKVDVIAEKHSLTAELPSDAVEPKQLGKREDHDLLPDEIKAKFVENLDLLRRMRELHLRLRTMSLENATCPDSERYPFLKELIELDKRLHKNWEEYDHFVISSPLIDGVALQSKEPEANAKPKAAKKATAKTAKSTKKK